MMVRAKARKGASMRVTASLTRALARNRVQAQELRASVVERDSRSLMPLANDGIPFRVADALLVVHDPGALRYVGPGGDAAPHGDALSQLPAALAAALAQEDIELAASGPLLMNPLVEPGEADADDTAAGQPTGDRLGTPLRQQGAHDGPDGGRQLAHTGRGRRAPLLGQALSLLVAVAASTAIAAQLTANRGLVASQLACDLTDREPLLVRSADLTASIVSQIAVASSHVGLPRPSASGQRAASKLHPKHPLPQYPALHFLVQSAIGIVQA